MKRNYDDPQYEIFRKKVLRRDRYKCKICGSKTRICVHHLDGWSWFLEGRYEPSNGICLCKEHHDEFHKYYDRERNTKYQFEHYLNTFYKKTIADLFSKKKKK